jgi:hypothetical protein
VRAELERGGVTEQGGSLRFEPDLDRGLERCENVLLAEEVAAAGEQVAWGDDGLPAGLAPYMERVAVNEGTVVLRQEDPPGDLYVLAEGRLAVETVTPEAGACASGSFARGASSASSPSTLVGRAPLTSWPRPPV